MSTDRAILIGSGIIALSIIGSAYVSGSWPIVVVTLLLVLVTYVHARIMKRVEWFTGGACDDHGLALSRLLSGKRSHGVPNIIGRPFVVGVFDQRIQVNELGFDFVEAIDIACV